MPGAYSHTRRNAGIILTADGDPVDIYNTDHQKHITFKVPASIDDYSANTTQMREQDSPGDLSTEIQAVSLAEELQQLRYTLKQMKGSLYDYWYEPRNLITIMSAVSTSSGSGSDSGAIPDYAKIVTVMFNGISCAGAATIGIVPNAQFSGHNSLSIRTTAAASVVTTSVSRFAISTIDGTDVLSGYLQMILQDSTSNIWIARGKFIDSVNSYITYVCGNVTLSATLSSVRVSAATADFDAGEFVIAYQ